MARVSRDILESTRKAQIDGVSFLGDKVTVGMANGNIMYFDITSGTYIPLRSEKLFNQSIVPNRQLFLDTLSFNAPIPSDPNGYLSFNRPLVTDTHLVLFSGSSLSAFPLTTKPLTHKPDVEPKSQPFVPYHSYPLAVTSSEFLMPDSLYLAP